MKQDSNRNIDHYFKPQTTFHKMLKNYNSHRIISSQNNHNKKYYTSLELYHLDCTTQYHQNMTVRKRDINSAMVSSSH